MSTHYKHQQAFAHKLAMQWIKGDKSVREVIRKLKNKAQVAYISAYIMTELIIWDEQEETYFSEGFLEYIDPNNRS